MTPGTLFLIPTTLGNPDAKEHNDAQSILPSSSISAVKPLKHFIVENERSARRFLSQLQLDTPIQDCTFFPIGKHHEEFSEAAAIQPLLSGQNVGLLSEAGCPGIADPGQKVISVAQQNNIPVRPLIGPSSILLALMASGANGQQFTFNGYLPVEKEERETKLRALEKLAQTGFTQIFIEVPHRNQQMLESLLKVCSPQTLLTIATNISLPEESIQTKPIAQWQNRQPEIKKLPTVFVLPATPGT